MVDTSSGAQLEARAQRLFLAQGSFAERELLPAATPDRRMLATDIDVLVSEYGSGFHLTRRHVECKSGKCSLLDRILWLNGVRTLLRADSSYLIATDADLSASDFARRLDVQLFTGQHLDNWERSIGISADAWPCRSDFAAFDSARAAWNKLSGDRADGAWRFFRGALAFVEVESWLTFRYRLLNKLFRMLSELSKLYDVNGMDRDQQLCARYLFSALLVRLSQYVLAICADVGSILPLEIEPFLTHRLTFGDQDAAQAMDLTRATVVWVRESLQAKGIVMPPEIEPTRLHLPPLYTPEVVSLIKRILDQSNEARYLPLAVERMQFGLEADDKLPRFRAAASAADSLAALLKGFAARTFKVPAALLTPVHSDLVTAYRSIGSTVIEQLSSVAKAASRRSTGPAAHQDQKDKIKSPQAESVQPQTAGSASVDPPDKTKASQADLPTLPSQDQK